jgi:hypothetical protein
VIEKLRERVFRRIDAGTPFFTLVQVLTNADVRNWLTGAISAVKRLASTLYP